MPMINAHTRMLDILQKTSTYLVEQFQKGLTHSLASVSNTYNQLYFSYINQDTNKDIDTFANALKNHSKEYISTYGALIGEGNYGRAYKLGSYVIKIALTEDSFQGSNSNCARTSRITNEFNDSDYSREANLSNGEHVLVSKFIQGHSVTGKKVVEFMNSKDRVMYDIDSEGNVKEGSDKNLYLIDSDMVFYKKNHRKQSIASDEFHENLAVIADTYDIELSLRGWVD
ncbi:kinase [Providencia alcalifaciens]|uniref:kinase n=1 Tax=Providencia TaxID=586 RepID=UPI002349F5F0|nr:kinase [Providencia sp. PROV033]